MLSFFWDKNRKNAFLKKKMSLTKFSTGLLCGCEQRGAPDWKKKKKTQKVEIAEETEFLRISQKWHFPKIYHWFWFCTRLQAETRNASFLTWAQGYILQSQFSPFCNRKFSFVLHTSGLSAKVWNLNNTISTRKNHSRKCFEAHQFMVQTH